MGRPGALVCDGRRWLCLPTLVQSRLYSRDAKSAGFQLRMCNSAGLVVRVVCVDNFPPPGVPQSIAYDCTAYYYRTLYSCAIAFGVHTQDWNFLLGHSPVAGWCSGCT